MSWDETSGKDIRHHSHEATIEVAHFKRMLETFAQPTPLLTAFFLILETMQHCFVKRNRIFLLHDIPYVANFIRQCAA